MSVLIPMPPRSPDDIVPSAHRELAEHPDSPMVIGTPTLVSDVRYERRDRLSGFAQSMGVHAVIVVLLISGLALRGGHKAAAIGVPDANIIHAMLIDAQPPVEDEPKPQQIVAKPVEEPAHVQVPPTPVTPPKRKVIHPPPKVETKPTAGANGSAQTKEMQAKADEEADENSLLDGVRDHWLQPPGPRRLFRCHLKVDYQAGGIITAVTVISGCGAATLDDSVERAIWKTQPLPIGAARNQAGSIEIDFTP